MRSIFTYPNNPFFIDPDYLGDDTAGFQRRIKDLKNGTYLPWGTATVPTQTVDELMTGIGKYYNYYDTTGTVNITRHDMWDFPLVELNMEEIPGRAPISFEIVSSYPTLNSNNKPFAVYQFTCATPHGFTTGDPIVAPSGNAVPVSGAAGSLADGFAKAVSSTVFEVYGNAACTEILGGGTDFLTTMTSADEVFIWNSLAASNNAYGAPQMGLHLPNGSASFLDGDAIRRTEDLDNTNWSGDGANNVVRYVDNVGANDIRLYEDAALTTPLSVTPEFVNTNNFINGSQGFGYGTGPQQYILENISYVGDQSTRFKALSCFNESGEKRIKGYVTVYSEDTSGDLGPLQFSSVSLGVGIGDQFNTTATYNAPRYQKPIWIELNHQPAPNTNITVDFTLWDAETGGNKLEFSARSGNGAASSQTAYWDVYVIEPALNQSANSCTVDEHTWFKYADGSVAGGDAFWPFWRTIEWDVPGNYAYHRYQTPNIIINGVKAYTYQDSSNVTQSGAQFSDYVALPGAYPYTLRTSVQGAENEAAVFTINLNATSQVDTITTTGGIYNAPTATQFQNRINPLASQYVPPAPTPVQTAAAQDNFDLNDIWYTTTTDYDYSRDKTWPRYPTPASAEITETQPSITTNSQSGIKYTRSGGFSKSGIALEYPLLNEADFRLLQNASQLARGQTAVFRWYFVNPSDTNSYVWRLNQKSNRVPYVVSIRDNDRIYLLEGFQSNESEVLKEGQLVSIGSSYNGELSQNVATVNANVFGEVESRLAYKPGHWLQQPGTNCWLGIDSIVVTLAEDDFVYKARPDGLYDVSVKFDFAWYHAS